MPRLLAALAALAALAPYVPLALLWACGPQPPPDNPADPPSPWAEILARSDLPEPLPAPLPVDPLGVTIHRLDNGLTVYISSDDSEPRISAWIAVRAGSRHDPAHSTGLAHYLEHMLFKGSDELGTVDMAAERPHIERVAALYRELRGAADDARRAEILAAIDRATQESAAYAVPNEIDQLYARLGVRGVNAYTSNEQTVYIADIPKNRFEQWARVEGERFRDAVFRLFYPELEAVYEEKNRSLDQPVSRVFETLERALFPGHPYGTQPTLGVVEHLETPAYDGMVAYFERWYAPNNMAIVLAGDIDARTALPVLERYFGGLAPRPLPQPPRGAIAPLSGRVQRDLTASGEAAVYLAWHTVPVGHPDEAALEVLDLLMDNATSGLINVELVLSQKLPRAGSFPRALLEAGYWVMYGVAREGQSLDEVERLLLEVVGKLVAGQFTRAELDAIVLHRQMSEMLETEANDFRVRKMTEAFVHHLPWARAARRSEALRRVTREDVVRVARAYLGGDYVVVRRSKGEYEPPKVPKPTITPIAIDPGRRSPFAAAVEAMAAPPVEPEWLVAGQHYRRAAIASGDLISVHNGRNELFAIDYLFEVGSRTQPLLCFALELMEQAGTAALEPRELQRTLYQLGTTISTACEADRVRISVTGIDRNMAPSIALLGQWLAGAALSEETYRQLLANVRSRREDEKDDPATIGRALAAFTALAGDSEYLLAPPTSALEAGELADLRRLLAELPGYRHHTFYFGPRTGGEVGAEGGAAVALGRATREPPARPPTRYRQADGPRVLFVHRELAKASVYVFFPRPPTPARELPLSRLYSEYVGGGMGALVFQEIREARGLAYSAWAGHQVGDRPGDASVVVAGLETQGDKTVDALDTLLGLLTRMPVQAERLITASKTLTAGYRASRVEPRRIASQVFEWGQLGFDADPRPGYWKALEAIDAATLREFATRSTRGPVLIAILGDRSRIDMDALGRVAPVTEVAVDQLFSY